MAEKAPFAGATLQELTPEEQAIIDAFHAKTARVCGECQEQGNCPSVGNPSQECQDEPDPSKRRPPANALESVGSLARSLGLMPDNSQGIDQLRRATENERILRPMAPTEEHFKLKHAKSMWMSAEQNLGIARDLAKMGGKEGNLEEYMAEGGYGNYLAEVVRPPRGQGNFISTVPLFYAIYNGIELALKAYDFAAYPEEKLKKVYKTPELVERVSARSIANDLSIMPLVDKYMDFVSLPPLLRDFLTANQMDVAAVLAKRRFIGSNNWFNAVEGYQDFFYTAEQGKAYFAEVLADVEPAVAVVERLMDDIDEDGVAGKLVSTLEAA
ncbi:MAG: hypothetical protein LBL67_04820 [Coriobacteriales bacterium]|jgi:hypothetical protein|nr:hypothetical protein [Coriobacteriales bacterium]